MSWGRDLAPETLASGLTTVRFKQEIIDLFRSEKYSARAALEIGAGKGTTTAALAVNFDVVVAMENQWDIGRRNPGPDGFRINSDKLLRSDGSSITNIVRFHADSALSSSFSVLADQNFSAAVIDGDHAGSRVLRDTFNVLRNLPCCVETIVYHDYCDQEVYTAIQSFVKAGILAFRKAIGERNWWHWWCKDERPEGAAMRVLRHPFDDFHERVEKLYQAFLGNTGSLQGALNGSRWLLLDSRGREMSLLEFGFWPSSSYVKSMNLEGPGAKLKAGVSRVLPGHMPVVSIISRQHGHHVKLLAELDRDLRFLRLHVPKEHPMRMQCGIGCMGINLRWSIGWAKEIDHALHVDELLGDAAQSLRSAPPQQRGATLS